MLQPGSTQRLCLMSTMPSDLCCAQKMPPFSPGKLKLGMRVQPGPWHFLSCAQRGIFQGPSPVTSMHTALHMPRSWRFPDAVLCAPAPSSTDPVHGVASFRKHSLSPAWWIDLDWHYARMCCAHGALLLQPGVPRSLALLILHGARQDTDPSVSSTL